MLTKGKNSKFRAVKYVAMVLALVAVLAFSFTACGKGEALSAEYLAGTLEKSQYNPGETFDCTGAQMKVTYGNGDVETVAITSDMVGTVVLSFGMSTVEATYSEDGKQIKCAIPVTVIDPLSNDKSAAISVINAKDEVKAGNDKGIAAMVAEYTNRINAATVKADITALSGAFDAELAEYVEGKAAALARVELTDEELTKMGLYKQFLLDVKHAQTLAISNIKAALSVEQANDLAAAFEDTIAKKLAEQSFYEGSEDAGAGQIDQKLDIIKQIRSHIAKAKYYISLIEELGAKTPENEAAIDGYEAVIEKLELLQIKVELAINLKGLKEEADALEPKTGIDDVYDLIKDGVTVTPAPYKADGVTLDTENDKIDNLILEAKGYYDATVTMFNKAIADALAENYKVGDKTINLIELFKAIADKKDELDAKQAAISATNATVAGWSTNAPNAAGIKAAWAELKTWGEGAIAATTQAIVFDADEYDPATTTKGMFGAFDIVYVTSETENGVAYEGKYAVDAWSGYYVTADDLAKYYFPNLKALQDATVEAADAADDVVELVKGLGPIVYTHNTELDAKQRLEDAREAYDAYMGAYDPAVNDINDYLGVAINEVKIALEEAEDKYFNQLVPKAEALNGMIANLGNVADIVIADYADGAKLKVAYEAYLEFAELNSYPNSENVLVKLTDVIADVDGLDTTDDDNEAHLLACMEKYTNLKFDEEVKNKGIFNITAAYTARMNANLDDTALRTALGKLLEKQIMELHTKASYDRTGETKFTMIETMQANIDKMVVIANGLAQEITDFVLQ